MDILAQRLKKVRENIKKSKPEYTQSFVAKEIGVARTTYTAYENGTKMPPIDTLSSIAKLFDVSIDYLLGHTEKQKLAPQEEDADFQAFAYNPELQKFYKELPYSKEEAVQRLRDIWEILKHEN
ncbi:helix-turn-helix domain-containing protein [Lysinibacillus sp. NPDC093712]|uniref:helix-turn-helix domain-containing protein n=1 Tax=Lysinibacillus sp. NPDC093712 TaxID=3390579 RepID=UPI003D08E23A